MTESQQLPPKPEVALALLQTAFSVYVHLDPRPANVRIPVHFKKQPQLVLQVGLNMAVPIVDLDVGTEALSCTLSFNRRPEFCWIPWEAIYGLLGDDGRGMIWPDSVPPEVAAAAEGRVSTARAPTTKSTRPRLRLAGTDEPSEDSESEEEPEEEVPSVTETAETAAEGSAVDGSTAEEREAQEEEGELESPAPEPSSKKRELPPYLRVVK